MMVNNINIKMSYPIQLVTQTDQFLDVVQNMVDELSPHGVFQVVDGISSVTPSTHTIIVGDQHYLKSMVPDQPHLVFSLNPNRVYGGTGKSCDMICWFDGQYRTTTIKYSSNYTDTTILDIYHQLSGAHQKLFIDGKLSIVLHIASGHITCILS